MSKQNIYDSLAIFQNDARSRRDAQTRPTVAQRAARYAFAASLRRGSVENQRTERGDCGKKPTTERFGSRPRSFNSPPRNGSGHIQMQSGAKMWKCCWSRSRWPWPSALFLSNRSNSHRLDAADALRRHFKKSDAATKIFRFQPDWGASSSGLKEFPTSMSARKMTGNYRRLSRRHSWAKAANWRRSNHRCDF